MVNPAEARQGPRIYGNRELAKDYLRSRIDFNFNVQHDREPLGDLNEFAALLKTGNGSHFAMRVIDEAPMDQIKADLKQQGYDGLYVDSEGLQTELATQLDAFLALPEEGRAAYLKGLRKEQ